MAIESIRIMETCKNYQVVTQTLYCFDSIISGSYVRMSYWKNITNVHAQILRHLVDTFLKNQTSSKKLDQYAYDTFECFVNNKDHIHINIMDIRSTVNRMMEDLVLYGRDGRLLYGPQYHQVIWQICLQKNYYNCSNPRKSCT